LAQLLGQLGVFLTLSQGFPKTWEKQIPLSHGVQARRKALRTHHTNGMAVCKKRPGGFKKEARGFK
jgi:hypothetical protein